jgi:hypothetical protein
MTGQRGSDPGAVTVGSSAPDAADAVDVGEGGPDPDAPVVSDAGAGTCVDVEPAPSELTCATDQDCALIVTGQVCSGYELGALCETGAANSSGV